MRMRKYAFLYESNITTTTEIATLLQKTTHNQAVYVIHKIETYPRYNYPTVFSEYAADKVEYEQVIATNAITETSISAITPYRTVSHYGFNYPLNYLPSISLYPENLLNGAGHMELATDLQLQRHLVIEFLKSAALNLHAVDTASKDAFISVKKIQLTSLSSCNETETEEETNYTTVKQFQLMLPPTKRHWPRTNSSCSTNRTTTTTSSGAEHEEEYADCSAGSCSSIPVPPPLPGLAATALNDTGKNLRNVRKSSRHQSSVEVAELEFVRRQKPEAEQAHDENSKNNNIDNANERLLYKRRASSSSSTSTAVTARILDVSNLHNPQQQQQQQPPQQQQPDSETSVKARINVIGQHLEINLTFNMGAQNPLSEAYFKHLSHIIDTEIQLISQQLAAGDSSATITTDLNLMNTKKISIFTLFAEFLSLFLFAYNALRYGS